MLQGFRLFQMASLPGLLQRTLQAYLLTHGNPHLQYFYEDMAEGNERERNALLISRDITMLCNWDYYCEYKGWMG